MRRARTLRGGVSATVLALSPCLGTACGHAADARPDIVLVVLDTLRRDVCGPALGGEGATGAWPAIPDGITPNLARLAAQATVFTRASSAAPWTVPAHASIFTGLLPGAHGCESRRPRLGDVGPTLAELLSKAGYATAAFYSNPWLSDEATGLLRGFDTRIRTDIGGLDRLTAAEGDQGGAATVARVTEWLARRDQERPCFLFVNLLEAHLPYDPPAEVRAGFTPPLPAEGATSIQEAHAFNAGQREGIDATRVRALYAGDARTADARLGALLTALEAAPRAAGTALAVTSDHGENLCDHALMEHQFSLHETVLAVPLVVRVPDGRLAPGRRAEPVSTVDLYATLLELAGLERPADRTWSVSLLRPAEPARPIFSDYAAPHPQLLEVLRARAPARDLTAFEQSWRSVRVGPLRLTVGSAGTLLLNDVEADPRQEHDLAAERPAERRSMLELLRATRPRAVESDPQAGMDARTRSALEALGYAADGAEGR